MALTDANAWGKGRNGRRCNDPAAIILRMEFRQLESLVAIAESGSFSRAAVALNLTQPSLSRQISLLEQELGQRLLVRTGRGVAPSAAGEAFLVHARAMLETSRSARDEMRDLDKDPEGRVMIGMPPRVALGLSAPLIQSFRKRFPRAVVTVIEALSLSLRESMVGGRLDMALMFDPLPSPQLTYEQLMRERLVLVGPPRSRMAATVSLTALATLPMVMPNAPNAIRSLVDGVLAPRGISLDVIAEVGAVQTVLALVTAGVGYTILPESALLTTVEAKVLPRAPIGPPAIWNSLVLAIPRARPGSRLIRETAQLLRKLDFRKGLPGH